MHYSAFGQSPYNSEATNPDIQAKKPKIQATYSAEAIATIMETGAKSVTLKKEVKFKIRLPSHHHMAPIIMMIVLMKVMRNYEDFVSLNMKGKVFADNTGCVGWYR